MFAVAAFSPSSYLSKLHRKTKEYKQWVNTVATVLYIDDDRQALKLCRFYLKSAGFTVHIATSAAEARWQLNETDVDCIITDVGLPGEDGITFYRWVQSQPALRAIPFLFVSGHAMGFDAYLVEHRDRFFEKPLFFPALIDRIRELIATG